LGRLELDDMNGNTYTVEIDLPDTDCMVKHVTGAVQRLNSITAVIDGNINVIKKILTELEEKKKIVIGEWKESEDFEVLHKVLMDSFWKNFEIEMQASHPIKSEPKQQTKPADVIPLRNNNGHTLH
jgi:hypothetical protein